MCVCVPLRARDNVPAMYIGIYRMACTRFAVNQQMQNKLKRQISKGEQNDDFFPRFFLINKNN